MSDPAGIPIAVLAALAAAGSFGVAAALQHRQAQLAPTAGAQPFRLLAHLARRPLWLAGIAVLGQSPSAARAVSPGPHGTQAAPAAGALANSPRVSVKRSATEGCANAPS